MRSSAVLVMAAVSGIVWADRAAAQQETLPPLEVIGIAPEQEPSASSHYVPREEIAARPVARTGEVLEAAPGLIELCRNLGDAVIRRRSALAC
jgi:hypothetical protein